MHRIKAMRGAQKISGCLRTATNARQLGHAMRLDVQFKAGLNDGRRDGVVAATSTQGRNWTFVVTTGVADLVFGQFRMMHPGFGNVGHAASFCRGVMEVTSAFRFLLMAWVMKRAVIGVPS